jgi:ATP-dependent DNA helicase 2 subunit 2
LKELTDLSDGVFATYAEVFESTKTPKVKQPRHVPTLKCQMILVSLDQYEESFSFSVERYARTKKATPPSSHKVSVVAGERDMKLQSQAGPGAAIPPSQGQVRQQRAYKTADGKEVEREQLERGYKYGSTIVGLSEADQDYLRFKSDASIMILGFLPKEDAFQEQPDGTIVTRKGYKRYLHMGQVNQIVAPSLDNRSGLAVSAMIHALQEFDAYALARLVSKDNTAPQMVLLAPYLESGFEALYQVNLPLAEDVRQYKFAPLDRVKNIKGEYAKAHRYLPTEDLVDAMDNLVDSMSLDALAVKTEDGQMEDVFRPEETYSVAVHRTMQLISHRFFNEQSTEMPPPAELLMRPSKVPQQIIESEAFKSAIERTIQVADVKKVPPKTAYKRRREDTGAEPKREVDIEALLNMEDEEDIAPGGDQSDNPEARALEIWTAMLGDGISARDPIRSFKTLVDRCPIQGNIEAPFLQLQTLLDDMIFHSMGDEEYESALQLVRVMREEAVKHEVDNIYNAFYDAVYGRLSDQGREDFAALLDQNSLGHITDAEIEAAAEAAETSNTGGSAGEGEATSDKDRSIKEEGPDSSARPNGDDDGDETTDGD